MLENGWSLLAQTDTAMLAARDVPQWAVRVCAWVGDRHGTHIANLYLRDVTFTLPIALPDTMLTALPGRPLSVVVDLTGLIERPHTRIVRVECQAARGPSPLFTAAGHLNIEWPISSSPGSTSIIVADAFTPVCQSGWSNA